MPSKRKLEQPAITFPKPFLWGAAVASHSVEGGNFSNDWWAWEQRPGRIAHDASSKTASEHFERFKQDFELAASFGHKAVLLNLEWSRIEPEQGAFNEAALFHYDQVFETLTAQHLEPLCVLQQVTLPKWFADAGGWRAREAPERFAAYTAKVIERYGHFCRYWIPVCEPMHYVRRTHLEGLWPPGAQHPLHARTALKHIMEAHAAAYRFIHKNLREPRVGLSIRLRSVAPYDAGSSWDLRTARREILLSNEMLVRAALRNEWPRLLHRVSDFAGAADFLACGYYGRERVRFNPFERRNLCVEKVDVQGKPAKAHAMEAAPEDLGKLLCAASAHGLPLMITGNGISTTDDAVRCMYLLEHLEQVHRAMANGAEILGYFHRSLLDGFEWLRGYDARYGLFHVDRHTLTRTPNPSAYLYKEICETGAVRAGVAERFCPAWKERSHSA